MKIAAQCSADTLNLSLSILKLDITKTTIYETILLKIIVNAKTMSILFASLSTLRIFIKKNVNVSAIISIEYI